MSKRYWVNSDRVMLEVDIPADLDGVPVIQVGGYFDGWEVRSIDYERGIYNSNSSDGAPGNKLPPLFAQVTKADRYVIRDRSQRVVHSFQGQPAKLSLSEAAAARKVSR